MAASSKYTATSTHTCTVAYRGLCFSSGSHEFDRNVGSSGGSLQAVEFFPNFSIYKVQGQHFWQMHFFFAVCPREDRYPSHVFLWNINQRKHSSAWTLVAGGETAGQGWKTCFILVYPLKSKFRGSGQANRASGVDGSLWQCPAKTSHFLHCHFLQSEWQLENRVNVEKRIQLIANNVCVLASVPKHNKVWFFEDDSWRITLRCVTFHLFCMFSCPAKMWAS